MNKTVDLPFKPDMEKLKNKKNENDDEEEEDKKKEEEKKEPVLEEIEETLPFKINHNSELQQSDMDLISLAMDEEKDVIDDEK